MAIYEFTCVLTRKAVEKWYDWFAGRGIPVALVEDISKGEYRFSVWRGTDDRLRSDRWFASHRIVKSANQFPKPKGVK